MNIEYLDDGVRATCTDGHPRVWWETLDGDKCPRCQYAALLYEHGRLRLTVGEALRCCSELYPRAHEEALIEIMAEHEE